MIALVGLAWRHPGGTPCSMSSDLGCAQSGQRHITGSAADFCVSAASTPMQVLEA